MDKLYAWGDCSDGQLGISKVDYGIQYEAKEVPLLSRKKIIQVSIGASHTLFLTQKGSVYSCGNNDYGQLGYNVNNSYQVDNCTPNIIDALDSLVFTMIAAGTYHSVGLTKHGSVFSWGLNDCGQLGIGDGIAEFINTPRMVDVSCIRKDNVDKFDDNTINAAKVFCGHSSTFIILTDGNIYACGDNSQGNLGLSLKSPKQFLFQKMQNGCALMIDEIIISKECTFFKSMGGLLYSCGHMFYMSVWNSHTHPKVRSDLHIPTFVKICSGESHFLFLSKTGSVYSMGKSQYGQCGRNEESSVYYKEPEIIPFFSNSKIVDIMCGRYHSIVIDIQHNAYGFGMGANGQFGILQNKIIVPQLLRPVVFLNLPHGHRKWYTGSNCSFVTYSMDPQVPLGNSFLKLNQEYLNVIQKYVEKNKNEKDVKLKNSAMFSSIFTIIHSFSVLDACDITLNANYIDVSACKILLQPFFKVNNEPLMKYMAVNLESIFESIRIFSSRFNMPSYPFDICQIIMIAPWMVYLENVRQMYCTWTKMCLQATNFNKCIIINWIGSENSTLLTKLIVNSTSTVVKNLAKCNPNNEPVCEFLATLFDINEKNDIVDPQTFYVKELDKLVNFTDDYRMHLLKEKKFTYCEYPFLFNGILKAKLIHINSHFRMSHAIVGSGRITSDGSGLVFTHGQSCMTLFIDRKNILADTFDQLQKYSTIDLLKPLKISFKNEEAIDEGGVLKEFFLLLMEELLSPNYGMLTEYSSGLRWFSLKSFEPPTSFFKIGSLLSMAIHNNTIVNINFPMALYKKIIGKDVDFEDLRELDPEMAANLEYMQNYDEADFCDQFEVYFDTSKEIMGERVSFNLIPNGSNILVTKENRKLYLNKYVEFIFVTGVDYAFKSFIKGFLNCIPRELLDMFQPKELKWFVCGVDEYNWQKLKKHCQYRNGYNVSDDVIVTFWNVFDSFTQEEKIKFLYFLTGSPRVPVFGIQSVQIYIKKVGDTKRLPVAHTCFNLLDLPPYKNSIILKTKLLQAIKETEGFGIV